MKSSYSRFSVTFLHKIEVPYLPCLKATLKISALHYTAACRFNTAAYSMTVWLATALLPRKGSLHFAIASFPVQHLHTPEARGFAQGEKNRCSSSCLHLWWLGFFGWLVSWLICWEVFCLGFSFCLRELWWLFFSFLYHWSSKLCSQRKEKALFHHVTSSFLY